MKSGWFSVFLTAILIFFFKVYHLLLFHLFSSFQSIVTTFPDIIPILVGLYFQKDLIILVGFWEYVKIEDYIQSDFTRSL